MKVMIKNGLLVYISIILLAACSAGVPSESDARKALENNSELKQRQAKIESFSKTNGYKNEMTGEYIVEYTANVTWPRGRYEGLYSNPQKETTIRRGECYFRKTEKGWRCKACWYP